MLKWAFRQDKKLQKKIMLLSNVFTYSLDNFLNSFKKNVIYHLQTNNITSS